MEEVVFVAFVVIVGNVQQRLFLPLLGHLLYPPGEVNSALLRIATYCLSELCREGLKGGFDQRVELLLPDGLECWPHYVH